MFKYIVLLCLASLVIAQDDVSAEYCNANAPLQCQTLKCHNCRSVTCPPDDPTKLPTYLPDPTYCGVFYECAGGKAYKFNCAPGTYFDDKTDRCDWNVECGSRSTSTKPPTTTEAPTTTTKKTD